MLKGKIGVILSGGGAKGAYEVGFLQALSEMNIQPHVIAGTSIGALNGALYASVKNTRQTYEIMRDVWEGLKRKSPLKIDKKTMIWGAFDLMHTISMFSPLVSIGRPAMALSKILRKENGVFDIAPISDILGNYAPIEKLKDGLPFYVAISEGGKTISDFLHLIEMDKFLPIAEVKTHYVKIQDCRDENIYKTILASAALPLLFEPQEIDGKKYRDGCLGTYYDFCANTPVRPLVEKEECDVIIVCHLDHGAFFDSTSFGEDVGIIEVRPKEKTFGSALDPLKFDGSQIEQWIERGYEDSIQILKQYFGAIQIEEDRKNMEVQAQENVNRILNKRIRLPF